MAELLRCGFEETVIDNTLWHAKSGTAAVNTVDGIKHSGSWSLKIFPSGTAASNVRRDMSNPTSGTIFTRFYIYPTAVAAAADVNIAEHRSSGNVSELLVRLMRTGVLRLENIIAAHTVDTSTVLSLSTWYRVEISHLLSDTVGTMELRLYLGDSTTALETIQTNGGVGEDTLSTNLGSIYIGQGPTTANSGTTLYYDDVGMNNDTADGTSNTSWLGPGKMYLATGISDTSIQFLDQVGGTATFANVDDVPGAPDDLTTYNVETANSEEDKFAITQAPAEVPSDAVMKVISAWARVSASASSGTLCIKIWDEGGTGTQGPSVTVTSTTWQTLTNAQHQSYDISAKTKANLNSFSLGYRSLTGAVEKRITAVWMNVEWLEASGASTAQMAPAFQFPGAMIGRRYV